MEMHNINYITKLNWKQFEKTHELY
jgi:hypothetical protein